MSFDAAHRLVHGYEGKCANVHGHTWKIRFEIESNSLNEFGFVRDFSDFKVMKEWVDTRLDHAMLVSSEDEVMAMWLKVNKQAHFVMTANPTSENLAKLLYDTARVLKLPVTAVEVDETCTSMARYEER